MTKTIARTQWNTDPGPARSRRGRPLVELGATGRDRTDDRTWRDVAAERQRDELKDLLLRKSAEFDNYRKRTDRERQTLVGTAAAGVLEELLPLVDDLERALQAEPGRRRRRRVPARRRADPPAAAGDPAQARREADRVARRRLSIRITTRPSRTSRPRAPRRGDHRRVPPRVHARRSPPAAVDGESRQRVERREQA